MLFYICFSLYCAKLSLGPSLVADVVRPMFTERGPNISRWAEVQQLR